MESPGGFIVDTVQRASSMGFIPIAVHFGLFELLVKLDREVTASEVVEEISKNETKGKMNLRLAEDTLYIMAGAGLLDQVNDDKYKANTITHFMVANPTSIQGALWFTLEALLGGAFIYPKLVDSHFEYPFKENAAPFQYAYEKMGNARFSKQHIYETMHDQGRMPSFNHFMEGKFGLSIPIPQRAKGLGYDLDSLMLLPDDPHIVDIGGGQGQMLQQLKDEYPHLKPENLILQEFNEDINPNPAVTTIAWNFKSAAPQPVLGAQVYSLMHIFHNMADLEALQLMQKLAAAMKPYSRLLIHEFSKTLSHSKMHASMISSFAGRERSSKEWHFMAGLCGLKVTFEAYVDLGEGLVEMQKV